MSFNFLLWPLYILMIGGFGIAFLVYSKQSVRDYPRSVTVSFILIGVGGILAAVLKLSKNMGILGQQYIDGLTIITSSCGFLALPFLFWGGYNKVKHDPEKRKLVLKLIVGLVVTLLIMALIVLSSL